MIVLNLVFIQKFYYSSLLKLSTIITSFDMDSEQVFTPSVIPESPLNSMATKQDNGMNNSSTFITYVTRIAMGSISLYDKSF